MSGIPVSELISFEKKKSEVKNVYRDSLLHSLSNRQYCSDENKANSDTLLTSVHKSTKSKPDLISPSMILPRHQIFYKANYQKRVGLPKNHLFCKVCH